MHNDYLDEQEFHNVDETDMNQRQPQSIQMSEQLSSDMLIQRCGEFLARNIGKDVVVEEEGAFDPYNDPRFVRWLEQNARVQQSPRERAATTCMAASFAVRMRRQIKIARAREKVPVIPLLVRDADVFGTVGQVAKAATKVRCAPWLDTMAVAAGVGREVWDEPCERWVELPRGVPRAGYVALNVAGDSMTPMLVAGDVLLVKVGARAREGALVVARHPDDGYVVKYVGRLSKEEIELESFNPNYAPFKIENDCAFVVGTVSYVLRYDKGITES